MFGWIEKLDVGGDDQKSGRTCSKSKQENSNVTERE